MSKKQEKIETITINEVEYVRKDQVQPKEMGDRVLVRCRNAGVHVGTLNYRDENIVVLKNANRIWKWSGAFTLSAVAMNGVDRSDSRIAVEVPNIELTNSDVCEIIPVANDVDLSAVNYD